MEAAKQLEPPYSLSELARENGISRTLVLSLVTKGVIPAKKAGTRYLIARDVGRRFLDLLPDAAA